MKGKKVVKPRKIDVRLKKKLLGLIRKSYEAEDHNEWEYEFNGNEHMFLAPHRRHSGSSRGAGTKDNDNPGLTALYEFNNQGRKLK